MASRPLLILLIAAGPALGQTDLELVLEGFEDDPLPQAQDEFDAIEEVLEGFDLEATEGPKVEAANDAQPERLRISGSLSERLVFNLAHDAPLPGGVDHRGLSSLRSRLDLRIDADLGSDWRARAEGHFWVDHAFRIHGRSGYPAGFLDEYQQEAELGELYLQGPVTEEADLTLGRQVVVWGRADHFRVTDILNPLDNRLPGMTDIEDVRLALPVAMVRIDVHSDPWTISLLAIPERRFDKRPVPGSDFFTAAASPPPRDVPASSFGSPEFGVALTGVFSNWDLSLYAASVFDDRPHVALTGDGARLRHNRIRMLGAAGNFVAGNWLLKAEAAAQMGLRYSNVPDAGFTRLSVLAGVEYSGLADTAIAVEATNNHIADFDDRLSAPPDDRRRNEPASAIRISRSFQNDSVDVTLVALNFGLKGENGAMQRAQVSYDWTDSVDLTTGVVLYRAGDQAPFRGIGNNDRLFLKLDYHF